MGQLKALLAWEDEQPLVAYQAANLLRAPVDRVVVVVGYRAGDVGAHLAADDRLDTVVNPDFASGKVSSIVAGVRACADDAHVLVLGVDQPRPAGLIAQV